MLKSINICGTRQIACLYRSDNSRTFMVAINDNDEKVLKRIKDAEDGVFSVSVTCGINNNEVKYTIPKNNILLYGEVDMDSDDDLDVFFMYKNKLMNDDVMGRKNIVPTSLDYDSGLVSVEAREVIRTADTWDLETWLKYNHCLIGKPNKILIYEYGR